VTPSVAAPSDTNPSDATVSANFSVIFPSVLSPAPLNRITGHVQLYRKNTAVIKVMRFQYSYKHDDA